MLNALAPARRDWVPATPSIHSLGLGLPGYLILFAPLAFAPQRQLWSVSRFRHRCSSRYLRISPLHREFHSPLPHSSTAVSPADSELSPEISQKTCRAAYAPFTPNNSEQRLPPRITAAAGTELAGASSSGTVIIRPDRKEFTSQGTSSSTRRCCVRVSPIAQNSPLLPPVGVWTVFQFQCGRAPSQAGYRSPSWWAITPPTN